MNYTGSLYRRSSFFIDVFNVIFYIDLFLFHEMVERMKEDECLSYYFVDGIPQIEPIQKNDHWVMHETASKKHQIILRDWIDEKKFLESNPPEVLDDFIYSLFEDMLTNPICNEYLQTTEFANALRILMGDDKVTAVYLYIPFESKLIAENLVDFFTGYGAERIQVIIGNKDPESKFFQADSFVFENVKDVDELLREKHTKPVEVLIPNYEFNLVEDRTDLEKLVEQVLFQRLNLEEGNTAYKEKYNLLINTIEVPI